MANTNACCSFCQKSFREVGPLVEGPGNAYICGDCAELCLEITKQEARRRSAKDAKSLAHDPESLQARLNSIVGAEWEATRTLARIAHRRNGQAEQARLDAQSHRARVLFLGPSQNSMILLCRALAHVLDVPFADGGLESLVDDREGKMVGVPLLHKLTLAGDFDIEKVQRGIIFVDEIERRETQEALLRVWNEKVHLLRGKIQIDITHILFVCGGRFSERADALTRIGDPPNLPITHDTLTTLGLLPEMIGHFGALARVPPLEEHQLKRLLGLVDFERAVKGKA